MRKGDVNEVLEAVRHMKRLGKSYYFDECRKRAVDVFDKNKCFDKYVELYNEILGRL